MGDGSFEADGLGDLGVDVQGVEVSRQSVEQGGVRWEGFLHNKVCGSVRASVLDQGLHCTLVTEAAHISNEKERCDLGVNLLGL